MSIEHIRIAVSPFGTAQDQDLFTRGCWPASWIAPASVPTGSFVAGYRLRFRLEQPACYVIHVSGDQRYELLLDGEEAGQGPQRGTKRRWRYESYRLDLPAGEHVLAARVTWLTRDNFEAPLVQMGVSPGFLLAAEGHAASLLSTGVAAWEACVLEGRCFLAPLPQGQMLSGATEAWFADRMDWEFPLGVGSAWAPAATGPTARETIADWGAARSRQLVPADLPAMRRERRANLVVRFVADAAGDSDSRLSPPITSGIDLPSEHVAWRRLLENDEQLTLPPHTSRRVLLDMEDYDCFFPRLRVRDGRDGRVQMSYAEALFEGDPSERIKGNRDDIEGKVFVRHGDVLHPDGGAGRHLAPGHWRAGRYIELLVRTLDQPLTIESLELLSTGYPLSRDSRIELDEPTLLALADRCWRTLEVCTHETLMDCPFYEQVPYVGDTLIESRLFHACCRDDRPARRALEFFAESRNGDGFIEARYPSWLGQRIPSFGLLWVMMLHDFALWRGDPSFVGSLAPVGRSLLNTYLQCIDDEGLLVCPDGWNFLDWVTSWDGGVPPRDSNGRTASEHWLLLTALARMAELEDWLCEPELAARWRRRRTSLAETTHNAFWNDPHSLYADTPGGSSFSQHVQALAILSDTAPSDRAVGLAAQLATRKNLTPATMYFRHFLLEAFARTGLARPVHDLLAQWAHLADLGLHTTPEQPEPTRSDAHAWSAHPLAHLHTTVLGVRPGDFGFARVTIHPLPGPLQRILGEIPHPRGTIAVRLQSHGEWFFAEVSLPDGIDGELRWGEGTYPLLPGRQTLELPGSGSVF